MLEVKNISVRHNPGDAAFALQDVSFSLDDGERLGLLGNNGAGKTTLLLTLVGILLPEQGDIVFDGMALRGGTGPGTAAAFRRRIGLVMQNPDDQLFMPTVYDDVAFGLRSQGMPEKIVETKTEGILDALEIRALKNRLSHRLSGGEKRLAALAGVLVMEPELLLLDEPATFLDPPGRERLIAILAGLSRSMIIATHDLEMAERLCSRVMRLDRGRIG
ncbi:MAG: energy-coupling factor ABC transporter ATP-binding protein [Treponema sp.]|jgi:cobalt/nickel transport system ATP-binding protein|nr:energy-coupling factor ABC transporter ATP-binding protein [Treponema sp.]